MRQVAKLNGAGLSLDEIAVELGVSKERQVSILNLLGSRMKNGRNGSGRKAIARRVAKKTSVPRKHPA
jgi:hypothetical protein